jgi:hypothetical protein
VLDTTMHRLRKFGGSLSKTAGLDTHGSCI